ncbi:MAG: glycosyltransferase 87 family protein [Myxococcales bacterium]
MTAAMLDAPRTLWREASLPSRVVFLALAGLFLKQGVYTLKSRSDRQGFELMGSEVLDGRVLEDSYTNSYPPTFAAALWPVAALSRAIGDPPVRYAWGAAQLVALGYLTVAAAELMELPLALGTVGLAWLLCWRFLSEDLLFQNLTLLLLALVTWSTRRALTGRPWQAGLTLALGTALKLWPALALPALLLHRRSEGKRLVLGFSLGLALAVGATRWALGQPLWHDAWHFWWFTVVPSAGVTASGNQSWIGQISRMAGPGHHALAQAIGLLPLLAVCGLLLRPSPRTAALDVYLLLAAGIPLLPVAWPYSYSVLFPLVLALLTLGRELPAPRRGPALGLLALGIVPASFSDPALLGQPLSRALDDRGALLFGALLVLAAGCVLRWAWPAQKLK